MGVEAHFLKHIFLILNFYVPLDYFLIVILADAHKGPNPQDEEDS